MKLYFSLLVFFLAGCQAPDRIPLPAPGPVAPVAVNPPAPPAPTALEQKLRRQAQTIEALMSQNDALAAQLAAVPKPTAAAAVVVSGPVAKAPAVAPRPDPVPEPTLSPNAEGVIDLAAAMAQPGGPVNPFTVRAVANDSVREVILHVGGIIAGPTACAVINGRLVEAGDELETLLVERIEPDAVYLRREGQRLRLPASEKPVRVRMVL